MSRHPCVCVGCDAWQAGVVWTGARVRSVWLGVGRGSRYRGRRHQAARVGYWCVYIPRTECGCLGEWAAWTGGESAERRDAGRQRGVTLA